MEGLTPGFCLTSLHMHDQLAEMWVLHGEVRISSATPRNQNNDQPSRGHPQEAVHAGWRTSMHEELLTCMHASGTLHAQAKPVSTHWLGQEAVVVQHKQLSTAQSEGNYKKQCAASDSTRNHDQRRRRIAHVPVPLAAAQRVGARPSLGLPRPSHLCLPSLELPRPASPERPEPSSSCDEPCQRWGARSGA